MRRLKTHLIRGGRFYKAGLYQEGELPPGIGEVEKPAPDDNDYAGRPKVATAVPPKRKIMIHLPSKQRRKGLEGHGPGRSF